MKLLSSWTLWPLSTWLSWLLGGALVASLAWNAALASTRPAAAPAPAGAASECAIDSAALGVSDDQARLLEGICAADCGRADELAAQADARHAELERLLASPELEPAAARALAREVGDLRARSVEACVEAVLRVREILTAEQTAALLDGCRERCRK
jgi:Spy/CpxP family protein refolding chaperone